MKKHKRVTYPSDQFAVIQPMLRNGNRVWFGTEKEALVEASGLLTGNIAYPGYVPPKTLFVVKVVRVVETASRVRSLKRDELI